MNQNNQYQKIEVNEALRANPDSDPNCLLGRRFLCRGSGGMIIGESGAGKSSFALQFASKLAVGEKFFGIGHPDGKPQRVLLVQAENDELEVAEVLQSIAKGEGWGEAKLKLLNENLHVFCSWDEGGERFTQWLGGRTNDLKIDVAFVDPLMSFCGCDVNSNKEMSNFLRQHINSQLKAPHPEPPARMSFGLVVIHHTPKRPPGRNKGGKDSVNQYDMLGASELTNWARFVMHLTTSKFTNSKQRVFEVFISKRGGRSGMGCDPDTGEYKQLIQYSTKSRGANGEGNLIHWEKFDEPQKRVRPPNPRKKNGDENMPVADKKPKKKAKKKATESTPTEAVTVPAVSSVSATAAA